MQKTPGSILALPQMCPSDVCAGLSVKSQVNHTVFIVMVQRWSLMSVSVSSCHSLHLCCCCCLDEVLSLSHTSSHRTLCLWQGVCLCMCRSVCQYMWHTHLMWALTFSENNLNQMYPHKAASHSQRDRRESARRDLQSFASFCLPTFRHFLESAPRVGTGNKSSQNSQLSGVLTERQHCLPGRLSTAALAERPGWVVIVFA